MPRKGRGDVLITVGMVLRHRHLAKQNMGWIGVAEIQKANTGHPPALQSGQDKVFVKGKTDRWLKMSTLKHQYAIVPGTKMNLETGEFIQDRGVPVGEEGKTHAR